MGRTRVLKTGNDSASGAQHRLYVLLPSGPGVDFVELAVIFVLATLLGFASHAPGGLGVFDAAMLVALWHFDTDQLLAGLLMFRLLYYIAPLAIALPILGVREIFITLSQARVALPRQRIEPAAVHKGEIDPTHR